MRNLCKGSTDRVIDLAPDGADAGGRLVAKGMPEVIAAPAESRTGQALHLRARPE